MDDTTKWCIATVLCVLTVVGFPTSCSMHADHRMAEVIKAGADPVRVACAFKDDTTGSRCLVAASEVPTND